ncbi:MAG: hypothetical protein J5786_05970 [Clostridiales bacterium]|nr:hypothetical protein [Clostridiales bacterium]
MNKGNKLISFYKGTVTALFFMFASGLLILNFITTSKVTGDLYSRYFYCTDNFIVNIAGIMILSALAVFLARDGRLGAFIEKLDYKKTSRILTALIFVEGAVWVFASGRDPAFDGLIIQRAVFEQSFGEYSYFDPGSYMEIYPNQAGLYLMSILFSKIFGVMNFRALGITDALFIALSYRSLSEIAGLWGMDKTKKISILFAGVIFFPFFLYTTFIYGFIPGLFFAVKSTELMVRYQMGEKKIILPVLSVIMMLLATAAKNNFAIFGIGLAIYVFIKFLRSKKKTDILFAILLIAVYFAATVFPVMIVRNISGKAFDQGTSPLGFVVMGLSGNSQNLAGGYDGYNPLSYVDAGCNTEVHKEMASQKIGEILDDYAKDPLKALNFMTRKMIHQWSDPIYRSFRYNQFFEYDSSMSPWAYAFLKPKVQNVLTGFMDFFQLAVYAGCVVFIFNFKKIENIEEKLLFPMIFIGGFLFHIAWEGDSRYALPYFFILFPVAAEGLSIFIASLGSLSVKGIKDRLKAANSKVSFDSTTALGLCLIPVMLLSLFGLLPMRVQFSQDNADYKEYLSKTDMSYFGLLSDGKYEISDSEGRLLGGEPLEIISVNGVVKIKHSSGKYLTATAEGKAVFEYVKPDRSQEFTLLGRGGDKLLILASSNRVLNAADDGTEVEDAVDDIFWEEIKDSEIWTFKEVK